MAGRCFVLCSLLLAFLGAQKECADSVIFTTAQEAGAVVMPNSHSRSQRHREADNFPKGTQLPASTAQMQTQNPYIYRIQMMGLLPRPGFLRPPTPFRKLQDVPFSHWGY